jgi:hypothetical protein
LESPLAVRVRGLFAFCVKNASDTVQNTKYYVCHTAKMILESHAIQTADAMASDIIGDILKPVDNRTQMRAG